MEKATGLTRDFDTSQGTLTLRRPGHETMKTYAGKAQPFMDDDAPALGILESAEVQEILYAAVTPDAKGRLDTLRGKDFIGYVELWKGYSGFCRFRELFILPLEAAMDKRAKVEAREMGVAFKAMVESGAVTKEEVREMMSREMNPTPSSNSPASTSSGEPTTAGTADK